MRKQTKNGYLTVTDNKHKLWLIVRLNANDALSKMMAVVFLAGIAKDRNLLCHGNETHIVFRVASCFRMTNNVDGILLSL